MNERLWRTSLIIAGIAGMLVLAACGDGGSEPGPQPLVAGLRAGANSTCSSIEEEGTAFCWGANEFGQVGDGSMADRRRPTPVAGAPLFSPPFPGDHTCALDQNGLYC